jgi:hypothetical protein
VELSELDLQRESQESHKFWKEAVSQLKKARDRVANRYNEGRGLVQYMEGDLVMCRKHTLSSKAKQITAKLANKSSAPLTIAKFVTLVTVVLANPKTGVVVRKAHVSHLKRYFPSP